MARDVARELKWLGMWLGTKRKLEVGIGFEVMWLGNRLGMWLGTRLGMCWLGNW